MRHVDQYRREENTMKKALLVILVCLFALPITLICGGQKADAGQKLIWARESEYDNLDPHLVYDVSRIASRLNLYDGLYRWQNNPPEIVPWVAEAYEVSSDGLRWTFKLRKGVKFHDGSEVTAEAVKYSMNRILALGQGAARLFLPIIKIDTTRVLDKYSVEFNLTKSFSPFLSIVPEIHIVNPKICKAHEVKNDWGSTWLASHEAGSGSYELTQYDPAVGFTMTRFKDHFLGWEGKHVDEVEFRTIREFASKLLALKKGEIHAIDSFSLPRDQIDKLKKDPDIKVLREPAMRIAIIEMHNQRPPMNDVHVRRAISYAFDYEGSIKSVMGDKVTRNPGPIPINMWGAPPDLKGYEYDLEKAKKELALAKTKIDRPLTYHAILGGPTAKATGVVLQNGLAQIGIKLNIVQETWPVLTGKAKKIETSPDMWSHSVSTYYPDPNNWIGEMYRIPNKGSWKSSSWYNNPKVDSMLSEALKIVDVGKRKKIYEEASHIVVKEAASIWVYNTEWYGPFRKNVHGIRYCPIGLGQEARWIYMD
jgi:peptide/nickel transport system substrate-binding protein